MALHTSRTRIALAMLALCLVACDAEPQTPAPLGDVVPQDTSSAADDERDEPDTDADTALDVASDTAPDDTASPDSTPPAPDTVEDTADPHDADTEEVYTGPLPSCDAEPGRILGRFCNGGSNVGGIDARIETWDCHGAPLLIRDTTDSSGYYELREIPPGAHTLVFEAKSYTATIDFEIEPGEVLDWRSTMLKWCYDERSANIAVLSGTDDHVETVLEGLGLAHDLWIGDLAGDYAGNPRDGRTLLLDRERLLEYDVLLINAGQWERWFVDGDLGANKLPDVLGNLESFVMDNGTILATGDAGHWLELLAPGDIAFYGDPAAPAPHEAAPGEWGVAQIGLPASQVVAEVDSERLWAALGVDRVSLALDPTWPVAQATSFATSVDMRTVAPVRLPDGSIGELEVIAMTSRQPTATSGRLVWTAFHVDEQPRIQMEGLLDVVVFGL